MKQGILGLCLEFNPKKGSPLKNIIYKYSGHPSSCYEPKINNGNIDEKSILNVMKMDDKEGKKRKKHKR